jgi:hypothetical protein
MKIEIEKNLVTLIPENLSEKAKVEQLWKILISCVGSSKKLSPVGEYVPSKGDKGACFVIEGIDKNDSVFTEILTEENCKVYCKTCNKLLDLKKGDTIPICCGKIMEIID